MRLLPKWHTPEEVVQQLIAGLEDGTLYVDVAELTPKQLAQRAHTLGTNLDATLKVIDGEDPPSPFPSLEILMRGAEKRPDFFRTWIPQLERLVAKVTALRAETRYRRRVMISLWATFGTLIGTVVGVSVSVALAPPEWQVAYSLLCFAAGAVGSWLVSSRPRSKVDRSQLAVSPSVRQDLEAIGYAN
jgi:hypothetical protein